MGRPTDHRVNSSGAGRIDSLVDVQPQQITRFDLSKDRRAHLSYNRLDDLVSVFHSSSGIRCPLVPVTTTTATTTISPTTATTTISPTTATTATTATTTAATTTTTATTTTITTTGPPEEISAA